MQWNFTINLFNQQFFVLLTASTINFYEVRVKESNCHIVQVGELSPRSLSNNCTGCVCHVHSYVRVHGQSHLKMEKRRHQLRRFPKALQCTHRVKPLKTKYSLVLEGPSMREMGPHNLRPHRSERSLCRLDLHPSRALSSFPGTND